MRLYCHVCGKVQPFTATSSNSINCQKCNHQQSIKKIMAKKNPLTDPDGSKARARQTRSNTRSTGERAKQVAESIGVGLGKAAETVQNAANTVTNVANKAHQTTAAVNQAVNSVKTVIQPLTGIVNGTRAHASGNLSVSGDPYGGLQMPVIEFQTLMPTDLLNPQKQQDFSQQQLNNVLEINANNTRIQKAYQSTLGYIEEVGKTRVSYEKARQSIIKGATQEVKTKQEIVYFDIANNDLLASKEKLYQSDERVKQERIKTVAAQNETEQLIEKLGAIEGKRSAEIERLNYQTQDIRSKYLQGVVEAS